MELKTIQMTLRFLLCGLVIVSAGAGMADEPWQPMSDDEIENQAWLQQATTVNELTARLRSPQTSFSYAGAALDEGEMDEAVELLRARYPLVSIRQRIDHLQRFGNGTFQFGLTQSPDVKVGTPLGIGGRANSLQALHSDKVRDFISRPGNGRGRFPPVSPTQLPLFESKFAGFDNAPVRSEVLKEPVSYKQSFTWPIINRSQGASGNKPSQRPTAFELAVRSFHHWTVSPFASLYSTGYFKSIDEVAGFEAHRVRLRKQWMANLGDGSQLDEVINPMVTRDPDQEIKWQVNRMQLVSLLLHQQPSVYVTDQLPNMEQLSSQDAPVRDVDAFEASALEQLKAGKDVVLQASANRIQMVGSVRSKKSCIDCHTTAKVGDLLGAFSYEILRSPLVTQVDNKNVN